MSESEIEIENYTNNDLLKCLDTWKFIQYYCPSVISVEGLRGRGRTLAEELGLEFEENDHFTDQVDADDGSVETDEYEERDEYDSGGNTSDSVPDATNKWFGFTPAESDRDAAEYFQEYVNICDKIEARGVEGLQCNNVMHTPAHGTISGSKLKVNGCFVKKTTVAENVVPKYLGNTDILAVIHCKKYNQKESVLDNRLKVMSAVENIMLYDVRRMFIYAISVEDCWMTIWYFARDHCVRTTFNWWKHKATMLSVFLSFMCATEEDLGVDPRIHLLPAQINHPVHFIYELQDGNQKKYYRTLRSILGPRNLRIIGRTTRVFEVVEVDSESDDAVHKDRPRQVIKDAWVDANRATESEIQERMLTDIRNFVNSTPDVHRERLDGWVNKSGNLLPHIAKYLGGGIDTPTDFTKLFLCIKLESTGPLLREIHHEYLRVPAKTFFEDSKEALGSSYHSTSRLPPNAPPLNRRNRQAPRGLDRQPNVSCHFSAKKRTFILFEQLCKLVNELPTVGIAFQVLADAVIALLLMYGAEWIHRDISVGNVMAFHNKETKRWETKLGDLEYAKRFTRTFESTNPKTGTPYFMAAEILRNAYFKSRTGLPRTSFFMEKLVSKSRRSDREIAKAYAAVPPDDDPVIHNFYHDVESLFWIAYWIVTSCVGHRQSQQQVARVFSQNVLAPTSDRDIALCNPITTTFVASLLPRLRTLVPLLEELRGALYTDTLMRNQTKSWTTTNYSTCHLAAYSTFFELNNPEAPWYNVKLNPNKSSHHLNSPKYPPEIVAPMSNPVSGNNASKATKRRRKQDRDEEDKSATKGSKKGSKRSRPPAPAAGPSQLR